MIHTGVDYSTVVWDETVYQWNFIIRLNVQKSHSVIVHASLFFKSMSFNLMFSQAPFTPSQTVGRCWCTWPEQ